MKTFTLTLLLSISALLSNAYTGNTYRIFDKTYTFTHKYDQGVHNYLFDCYTQNGQNKAIIVKYNDNHQLGGVINLPSEVTYNNQTYTVTAIANKAFSEYYSHMQGFIIPKTISAIGDSAFHYMSCLSQIHISDGVTRIGKHAFSYCHQLTMVDMGKNVEIIGDYAFTDCIWLNSINLPSSLTEVGKDILRNCGHLKYIDWGIDPSVLSIEAVPLRTNTVVLTKTRAQAHDAKKSGYFFDRVLCDEDETYIEGLEKTISDKDKAIAENNTMAENLVSQYTMLQQESQILQSHNNNLNNCDVNQDGQVNGTDVVTIYNRIIQGGSSYNGQYYVDLGLPSGTLWATCNVGAPSPECVGDYFAWGENGFYSYRYGLAFGKVEFTEDTYKPAPGVEDIENGEWPQEYSPLKVIYISQWDGWKIPTYNQADELVKNCTKEIVTVNGQECLELTSKINNRKIYFPLNGKIDGTSAKETNEVFYWTSTTGSSKYYAYIIPFQLHSIFTTKDKFLGMGIRPVITKDDITE